MKIGVIGANSYLARNLTQLLRNDELFLYDRAEAQADGLPNYTRIQPTERGGFDAVNFDCDLLYYFIGKTGTTVGFEDYETFLSVNEGALLHFLDAYVKHGSKAKIVYPSSRLVYKGRRTPLGEDEEKDTKSIYAVNKLASEGYLEAYHAAFGVRYVIFRICVPYGTLVPGATSYGTADFMLKKAQAGEDIELYWDGSQRRTLTYIGDVCRVLDECGRDENFVSTAFNIGGENYTLFEMARLIAQQYNVKVAIVPWPALAERTESGDTLFRDYKLQMRHPIDYQMRFESWIKGQ